MQKFAWAFVLLLGLNFMPTMLIAEPASAATLAKKVRTGTSCLEGALNDPTKVMHFKGGLTNKLRLSLIIKSARIFGSAKPEPQFLKQEQIVDQYEQERSAVWHQHHQLKNLCDVCVIMMPSVDVEQISNK